MIPQTVLALRGPGGSTAGDCRWTELASARAQNVAKTICSTTFAKTNQLWLQRSRLEWETDPLILPLSPVIFPYFPLYTSSEFSDVAVFLPTAEHGSSGGGEGSPFTDDAVLGYVRNLPFFLSRPVGFRLSRNVGANIS